jgi:hypothetical protein
MKLRRSGIFRGMGRICRPDGARIYFGSRFYKDVAPTALKITRAGSFTLYGDPAIVNLWSWVDAMLDDCSLSVC